MANSKYRELTSKIEVLLAEREAVLKEHLDEQHKLIVKHVDSLLAFVPDHRGDQCDELNPVRTEHSCVRCRLLAIKKHEYVEEEDKWSVAISVEGL